MCCSSGEAATQAPSPGLQACRAGVCTLVGIVGRIGIELNDERLARQAFWPFALRLFIAPRSLVFRLVIGIYTCRGLPLPPFHQAGFDLWCVVDMLLTSPSRQRS